MKSSIKKITAAVMVAVMIVFAVPMVTSQGVSLFAEANAADKVKYDYTVSVGEKLTIPAEDGVQVIWSVSDKKIARISNTTQTVVKDEDGEYRIINSCEIEPLEAGEVTVYEHNYSGVEIASWKVKINEPKEAVITLNGNGGYIKNKEIKVESGKTATLPTPEKSGYTCLGWATEKDATTAAYKCGESIKPSGNITLYAVWKANYLVSFDAGEGKVSVRAISVNVGSSCLLPTPTKKGSVCAGWAKEKDAITPDYMCGEMFKPSSSIKLYAIWTEQYTVTFDANGGKVSPEEVLVNVGETYPLPTASRKDYGIIGWATEKNATTATYKCGEKYKPTADVVLYAVWLNTTKLNGLYKIENQWTYYKNGKVDKTFAGMAKNDYGWWYVKNGAIDFSYTGMAKNDFGWWYIKDGKLDLTYTGMAKNQYGWWYMSNGKLDLKYTGMANDSNGSGGWMYVKDGKFDPKFNGMAKGADGWMYATNGKLNEKYTGMAKNAYGWWYIKNGKLDLTYTGISSNAYGYWYINKGKLDLTYTGTIKDKNNNEWKVTNGKAYRK